MNNRFERVCEFAEHLILQEDMGTDVDLVVILDTAQKETGETLETSDRSSAIQWLDYFCADHGYYPK
jgi:hypothetical protein